MNPRILDSEFFNRPPPIVARELLGKRLVRIYNQERLSGFIVEVEAYLSQGDQASHSCKGSSKKNASMFGPPGHLYVYPIHAKYCLNAVTEACDQGSAVLIRALEPDTGIETMKRLRDRQKLEELTRGPSRLCQALAVDRELDGVKLSNNTAIWIETTERLLDDSTIYSSERIGITKSAELPLRYFLGSANEANRFVSGTRKRNRQAKPWSEP